MSLSLLNNLLHSFHTKAVIFDLDGTLLDNNPFHLKAWRQYLKNIGREMSEEEYNAHINGRTNKDAVEYIYNRKMTTEEALEYGLQKEAVYRELYQPYIAPISGLLPLLQELDARHLPMAIATSGIQVNINFMFDHIPMKHYFKVVVNASHIRHGKPDPEIYITTASLLGVPAANCLVFEDAAVGVQAAKSAGMKVIAIRTTQSDEALSAADKIITDYTELLRDKL